MADKLFLASSNPGKLKEFRALAVGTSLPLELDLLPNFERLPVFDESAPTFAENSLGKALHYSQWCEGFILADDSGLVVPALGGRPGVQSARYAGPNATSAERNEKLLSELHGKTGQEREAYFACALSLVRHGNVLAVITARTDGQILEKNVGAGGFGYDPIFFFPSLNRTFAELASDEKNAHSHRGKAFRRLLSALFGML